MAIVVGTTYSQDGTRSGGSNNNTWAGIDYVLVSQNIANNTSTIKIRPWIQRNTSSSGSWDYDDATMTVKCDGQQKTTVIDYDMRNTSYNTKYYVTNNLPFRRISGNLEPYEFTFYHNQDGTKTVNLYAFIPINNDGIVGDFTVNINVELPTIPRASKPSINSWPENTPDFNIGDVIWIHMNRKADFTHTVRLVFGSYSYTIATGVTNNCQFNTNNIASYLYAQIPNTNYGNGTIYADTYSGSTLVGTDSCPFVAHVVNANPTFNNFTYSDSNSTTTALTGNNQIIIGTKSNLLVTISTANKATAKKGASISHYLIDGTRVNYSSSSAVTRTINGYNKNSITVAAVDSRGNSTTKTISFGSNFKAYFKPTLSAAQVFRTDSVGTQVKLSYSGKFWNHTFGTSHNDLVIKIYKYRELPNGSFSSDKQTSPTISGENFSLPQTVIAGDLGNNGFSIDKSFNVQIVIYDRLDYVVYDMTLIAGNPAIKVKKNKVTQLNLKAVGIPLTVNTSKVYSSDFSYWCIKIGNLVLLDIQTIAFNNQLSHLDILLTGLPIPKSTENFYLEGHNGSSGATYGLRVRINSSNGNLEVWWSGTDIYGDSANRQFHGSVMYLTND